MAAFRGVYFCILFNIAVYSIILHSTVGEKGNTSECSKPWYISLNEDLTISWTGEDRNAIVTAVIITKDVYDRNCDSSVTLSKAFIVRLLRLSNPCSNSLYTVTITLECDNTLRSRQNLTVRTPPEAPAIKSMKPANTSIEVTWNAPPGRIEIYRVTLAGRRANKTFEKETPTTFWTFLNLDPNTEYEATVSAKNEDHWGKKSTVLSAKTLEGAPDAPNDVTVSNIKNTSVEINWKKPLASTGPIIHYRVHWRNSCGVYEIDTKSNIQTYKLDRMTPYCNYTIKVGAATVAERERWSEEVIFRTDIGVPHPPTSLAASELKNTSITLQWNRPKISTGPIQGYRVHWKNYSKEGEVNTGYTNTFYTLKQLTPYVDYTMKVLALTAAGPGEWSEELKVRTRVGVPDPPVLEVLSKTSTSIFVKWTLSNIYKGPDPSFSLQWRVKNSEEKYDKVDDEDINETTKEGKFNITSLKPFKTYEIQIRGHNTAGFGRWSSILETDTLTGTPSVPRKLRVSSKSATHFVLTWDVPKPANGIIRNYQFQLRHGQQYSMVTFDAPEDNLNSVTVGDLSPYTDYNITLRASTAAGWGAYAPILAIKTDVGIPSEPLELTVEKVTNKSLHVRWLVPEFNNGPYVSYVMQWMEISDPDYYAHVKNGTSHLNTLKSKDVTSTSYTIRNLKPYTNYSIQVCAKTSAGRGTFTAPIIIQTTAGLPSPPNALEVIKIESTGLTLQWSAPEFTNGPLKGYVIHWGVKETKGSYVQTTSTSYDALGLRPYTEYFFTVAAETESGQGNCATVYPVTKISTPGVPRNLMAHSVKYHYILVVWTIPEHPNAPFLQYTVMLNMVPEETSNQVFETNVTACKIRELEPDKNYSIRVRASSNAGEGPWTETLYVRTKQKDNSSAIISGSVVGGILLLLAIVCAILFFYAKRNGGLKNLMQSKPEVKSPETPQPTTMVPLETICDSGKVPVESFDAHVLKLMANGYFKLAQEFEKLGKESPGFPAKEAKKSENLTKNRWVKILPFDYSRVKLRPVGDEVEPDFINASYVPGDSYLLEYIATQGPLPNTVNDFWRMVWQESVFLIVMLTQCTERAKKTCEKYWPSSGSTNKYGDLDVNTLSESITPGYIQRLFLVTQMAIYKFELRVLIRYHWKRGLPTRHAAKEICEAEGEGTDGKQRHIVHFHYMNWPVSGSPKSPDDFLTFIKTVRSQVACGVTGPMLVHCSAGIGRTGTFIAVDRLFQQMARESKEVDIYGTVLDMRKFRANMVQTEEQYYFIYLCLQRIIHEKRQNIDEDYGGGIYTN